MIPLLRKPLSHNHTHEALCALECLTRGVVATRRQKCGTTNKKGGKRGSGFLYAESDDGITWEKPNLGMTEFPPKSGNKNNNLLENDGMTTGIYLDESAPAAERYKITTGSNGAGAIAVSQEYGVGPGTQAVDHLSASATDGAKLAHPVVLALDGRRLHGRVVPRDADGAQHLPGLPARWAGGLAVPSP
jgi:hypothetical protein